MYISPNKPERHESGSPKERRISSRLVPTSILSKSVDVSGRFLFSGTGELLHAVNIKAHEININIIQCLFMSCPPWIVFGETSIAYIVIIIY